MIPILEGFIDELTLVKVAAGAEQPTNPLAPISESMGKIMNAAQPNTPKNKSTVTNTPSAPAAGAPNPVTTPGQMVEG